MSLEAVQAFADGGLLLRATNGLAAADNDVRNLVKSSNQDASKASLERILKEIVHAQGSWTLLHACFMVLVAQDLPEDSKAIILETLSRSKLFHAKIARNRYEEYSVLVRMLHITTLLLAKQRDLAAIQDAYAKLQLELMGQVAGVGTHGIKPFSQLHKSARRLLRLGVFITVSDYSCFSDNDPTHPSTNSQDLLFEILSNLRKGTSILAPKFDSLRFMSKAMQEAKDDPNTLLLLGCLLRQEGKLQESLECLEASIKVARDPGYEILKSRALLETILAVVDSGAEPTQEMIHLFDRQLKAWQEESCGSCKINSQYTFMVDNGYCSRCESRCQLTCLGLELFLACLRSDKLELADLILERAKSWNRSFPCDEALLCFARNIAKNGAQCTDSKQYSHSGGVQEKLLRAHECLRVHGVHACMDQLARILNSNGVEVPMKGEGGLSHLERWEARVNQAILTFSTAQEAGYPLSGVTIQLMRDAYEDISMFSSSLVAKRIAADVLYNLTLMEFYSGEIEQAVKRWLTFRKLYSLSMQELEIELVRTQGDLAVSDSGSEIVTRLELDRCCLEQRVWQLRQKEESCADK